MLETAFRSHCIIPTNVCGRRAKHGKVDPGGQEKVTHGEGCGIPGRDSVSLPVGPVSCPRGPLSPTLSPKATVRAAGFRFIASGSPKTCWTGNFCFQSNYRGSLHCPQGPAFPSLLSPDANRQDACQHSTSSLKFEKECHKNRFLDIFIHSLTSQEKIDLG